jgi:hypothetical protein
LTDKPYYETQNYFDADGRKGDIPGLLSSAHCPMYDKNVSFCSAIGFLLAWLLAATPSLACLPNSLMTPAEMDCCKKMAGSCDMGSGNHKCCATTVNHANPTAVIVHNIFQHDFDVIVVRWANLPEVTPSATAVLSLAAISPSPPGATTVLRI